ncbi:MAG: 1-deoxy-D-xylulose-5-phosphate synthase [Candidatus Izimaplasma sp.]|nr:1-deoxy-D-xylulose-5-phosphate synthase [Candidatus Izimaplasma bacterium]
MQLEDIKNPTFLKDYTIKECEQISDDIRNFLIDHVSKTGGHLSSNLGAVELTVALHKVFESPKDKIIFDVGHQAYTHKILTGRAKDFDTLRQYQGLSGYLKRDESIHDIFEAGHSSTSIAAAAGMEASKKYHQENYKVVPVIGDGALTAGMAFEALNFLGENIKQNPVVILNDNEMSISQNIGYLARLFNQIRSKSAYRKLKTKTARLMPKFLRRITGKVERGVKGFITTNTIFDDFGFSYYGPINGHNMKELIKYFNIAKKETRPCVIHVLTEKGKGYKYSEQDQIGLWHGVGPFEVESGNHIGSHSTNTHKWSEVISHYMENYAAKKEDFAVVVPAMVAGSGLLQFKEKYPDKLYDVGIAEQTAVTMSAGLAVSGIDVFCPIYSTFIQRAYDQVNHDVARQNLHVVFGIDRAGIVGADGETHQGIYDIPLLRHIPNMTILHPKDATEAFEQLNYAFKEHTGPIALRYPRGKTECDFNQIITPDVAPLTWDVTHQGNQAIFIAFGEMLNRVTKYVITHKLDVEVINARVIKPLDHPLLSSIISRELPIIIYEESAKLGGFGSSVLEYYNQLGENTSQITCLGIDDNYVQHGDNESLLKELSLDLDSVIKTIKEKMNK